MNPKESLTKSLAAVQAAHALVAALEKADTDADGAKDRLARVRAAIAESRAYAALNRSDAPRGQDEARQRAELARVEQDVELEIEVAEALGRRVNLALEQLDAANGWLRDAAASLFDAPAAQLLADAREQINGLAQRASDLLALGLGGERDLQLVLGIAAQLGVKMPAPTGIPAELMRALEALSASQSAIGEAAHRHLQRKVARDQRRAA